MKQIEDILCTKWHNQSEELGRRRSLLGQMYVHVLPKIDCGLLLCYIFDSKLINATTLIYILSLTQMIICYFILTFRLHWMHADYCYWCVRCLSVSLSVCPSVLLSRAAHAVCAGSFDVPFAKLLWSLVIFASFSFTLNWELFCNLKCLKW